jgi:radical SAM superfamily enzyme YgiQ (UPF0313 family)
VVAGDFSLDPTCGWPKDIVTWLEGNIAFVSVPFTWLLPAAYSRCVWYKQQGYTVRAGGPAVSLIPEYLADVAQVGGEVDALPRHNSEAGRSTTGCNRGCWFCAVPKTEGDLTELPFEDPFRLLCEFS